MHKKREIGPYSTLINAIKKMDAIDKKLLIVMDNNFFVGLVSAGDIQRAIINNQSLESKVKDILRKNIRTANPNDDINSIKKMMFDFRMELCPVVDEKNNLIKVYFWEDFFQTKNPEPKNKFNNPVVIMAGGFGTRLKPLTNVIPKPLIPIGEKTIIETIFDRFHHHGCNHFYLSVNYKSDIIEYYLKNKKNKFTVDFFKEDKPMGTAGSLSLIKEKINNTFFINNCDIIIEQDYSEILDYHKKNKNEITIVAALKHISIPYGTLETGENGILLEISEKPEYTFKINSGMYVLEPQLINEIPENTFYHITDLIEKVRSRNGKVGVFPVSEKSWVDIGNWNEYIKILDLK